MAPDDGAGDEERPALTLPESKSVGADPGQLPVSSPGHNSVCSASAHDSPCG